MLQTLRDLLFSLLPSSFFPVVEFPRLWVDHHRSGLLLRMCRLVVPDMGLHAFFGIRVFRKVKLLGPQNLLSADDDEQFIVWQAQHLIWSQYAAAADSLCVAVLRNNLRKGDTCRVVMVELTSTVMSPLRALKYCADTSSVAPNITCVSALPNSSAHRLSGYRF